MNQASIIGKRCSAGGKQTNKKTERDPFLWFRFKNARTFCTSTFVIYSDPLPVCGFSMQFMPHLVRLFLFCSTSPQDQATLFSFFRPYNLQMCILSAFDYRTLKMYTHMYQKLHIELIYQVCVCQRFQIFLYFHVVMVHTVDKLNLSLF